MRPGPASPRRRPRCYVGVTLALLLAACGQPATLPDDPATRPANAPGVSHSAGPGSGDRGLGGSHTTAGAATPGEVQDPRQPKAVQHDFGVIPHGEARTHDYVIDTAQLTGGPFVPLRAQLDCACGRATLHLRDADGNERAVDGSPLAHNAPQAGEQLIARVVIDTRTKDPEDLPVATSRGYIVLQPVDDLTGYRRVNWPFHVRFGIDCPVVVKPFAAIDFASVPQCESPELPLRLRGDDNHPDTEFRNVASNNPEIEARLAPSDTPGETRLFVRCRPGAPGNARAILAIETNMPNGYRVHIGVTWKVVPDLVATPMDKLSFRAHLERPQTAQESSSQYLLVADHDRRRNAEFAVHEVVDAAGRDGSEHFEIRFEPVPGRPRYRRVLARYLGGLQAGFRGTLRLTADGSDGPFLDLALVMFPKK
ncbi:MAG: hypothetical protein NXI31_03855 [bacterium]|nr:hypothetical protein [bacterium]